MREILFKAKRTDNGKWVEGYYVLCRQHYYILPIFDEDEMFHGFDDRDEEWIEINQETLCQYTGLTDKNGNRIWENDIVEERHRGLATMRYCAVWSLEECSWMLRSKSGAMYGIGAVNQREFEVIGNIFDNPELLKED